MPPARKAWIERHDAVRQRHHGADILAEIAQHVSGIGQDARVIAGGFQRSPREIGTLTPIRVRIFAAIVQKQPNAAECGPSERRSVAWIACNRLLDEAKSLGGLPCR